MVTHCIIYCIIHSRYCLICFLFLLVNDRDQQQNYKANENRPPRENKRPFTGSNNSTRGGGDGNRGGDGRPFRQNRGGRGRLPSREKQDGDNEKTGGNAGG